ncbi:MAG: hypothetical protein ACRDSL_25700, partial [Pseudonocardiaceae bacterium]
MHLVEADNTLTRPNWRIGPQEHVALCNAELTEDTPVPDFEDCPGCVDCTRYCKGCVRVAAEYSAGDQPDLSAPEDGDEDRPMGWVLVGECPHPVAGGPAFHVGPCRECDAAQRRRRRKDRQ